MRLTLSVTIFPDNVRLKPIALPTEHGGWGFILEPLLLGLAVAPSWTGLLVAMGALAGFLFRQPIRIIWADFAADRDTPRTHAALVFGGIYFVSACIFLSAAIAENTAVAVPLLAALPAGVAVLFFDSMRRSRSLVPEILGPVALGSTAASVAVAGGWSMTMAVVLWGLVVARSVPAILYVRARLRLDYGEGPGLGVPIGSHVVALGGALALGVAGLVAYVVSIPYLILLVRACAGLSRLRRTSGAKVVGFTEIGWGVFTIVSLALLLRI
jgi:hypothetical protein